tara:strand:+ start:360 stop:629 length:270 start_codon:yes stop_codon:yes gene_type:complete
VKRPCPFLNKSNNRFLQSENYGELKGQILGRKHRTMNYTVLIFTVAFLTVVMLIAFLPEERSKRVHGFIKMVMNLLPISSIIKAFKKND